VALCTQAYLCAIPEGLVRVYYERGCGVRAAGKQSIEVEAVGQPRERMRASVAQPVMCVFCVAQLSALDACSACGH
jgi:hypothetical protein